MFPLSKHVLTGAAISQRPILTMFGDGFTVWKWHAKAAKHCFLHSRIDDMEACNDGLTRAQQSNDATAAAAAASTTPREAGTSGSELLHHHPRTSIVTVRGLEHQNFTDMALFGPVRTRPR